MRPALVLVAISLAGCSSLRPGALALADGADRPAVTMRTTRRAPSRGPLRGPVLLRRRHGATAVYERTQRLESTSVGLAGGLDVRARSRLTVQRLPGGRWRETEDFLEIATVASGERRALERARTVRLHLRADDRNRAVELAWGVGRASPALGLLLKTALERLRVVYPRGAVDRGDRWAARPFVVDGHGAGIPVRIRVEPRFTVRDLERRDGQPVARIGWDLAIRVFPFAALGAPVEGQGRARGETLVELADGRTGHTALDITIGLRPAGTPATAEPPLRLGVRYTETVRRFVTAR
ncbi:MAG TPA: hypothetical protein RMH99_28625 [Sandaracinaceae bacterium LLY-WYZ-13_1]|nr:hypothetical protein [Sandaracinaceae bacterium LLY-WYZ-13_1]